MMSKYKVGDKVVLTVTGLNDKVYYPHYEFNNNFNLWEESIDELVEPLSTYTEPLEDTIQKYTVKIARLVMDKERLKDENEKMSVKIDVYELCGDQHEVEYNQAFNQGAEAAWELARKIILPQSKGGMSCDDYIAIFGNSISDGYVMKNYTYSEAAAKVAEWEKAKEEIKVGDVLENIYVSKVKCVVTNLYPDNMAYLVFDDGTTGVCNLNDFKKTGRHIDIDSFLKQIGGEGDEK